MSEYFYHVRDMSVTHLSAVRVCVCVVCRVDEYECSILILFTYSIKIQKHQKININNHKNTIKYKTQINQYNYNILFDFIFVEYGDPRGPRKGLGFDYIPKAITLPYLLFFNGRVYKSEYSFSDIAKE